MKLRLINLPLIMLLVSQFAVADCDYTQIIKNPDSSYQYSKELHICVGEMKRDLEIANKQKELLTQAIDVKSLAIDKADQRADLWMNTSFKLEDRLNSLESFRKTDEKLYFGLGILTMFASGYLAAQFYKH